jgi:DNA-binding NarL/FixJ family response regulator
MPTATTKPTEAIRVLITDDHPIVRIGLADLLGTAAGLRVVGVAGCGAEGVRLARALKPDVVVMDLSMPGMDGREATRQIVAERPATRVLILTAFRDRDLIDGASGCGAVGSVLKDAAPAELIAAVRAAAGSAPR